MVVTIVKGTRRDAKPIAEQKGPEEMLVIQKWFRKDSDERCDDSLRGYRTCGMKGCARGRPIKTCGVQRWDEMKRMGDGM